MAAARARARRLRPRHRIAGALQLPFGKGRHWLNQLHPVLEGIVGGWQVSSIITWDSGSLLTFGQMEWNGQDPKVCKPTPDQSTIFSLKAYAKPRGGARFNRSLKNGQTK